MREKTSLAIGGTDRAAMMAEAAAALLASGRDALARLEQAAESLAAMRPPCDMPDAPAPEPRRFVTIAECADLRPFSKAALRDMKFKAWDRTNSRGEVIQGNGTGPAGVWVQIGMKVLIDLTAFDAWLESRKATAQAGKGWMQ
ncbi:hypothetical protein MASR1M60_26480 [Rhodocyclaceae bacterium]